jgi:acetyltransferase-like isoleucine patch superfamily enzyme
MSVVFSDIKEGDIVAGNPAKAIKNRLDIATEQRT